MKKKSEKVFQTHGFSAVGLTKWKQNTWLFLLRYLEKKLHCKQISICSEKLSFNNILPAIFTENGLISLFIILLGASRLQGISTYFEEVTKQ